MLTDLFQKECHLNTIIPLIYTIILWISALILSPFYLYQLVVKKKYRTNAFFRFGFGWPEFKRGIGPVIWIHAVSLGETKAIVSLARSLKQSCPKATLIVSSITETGHTEALRALPFVDNHLYLPFDFQFLMKRLIKKFSPDLVIISESDFWFNFLFQAKQRGAFIALVNGKISQRSTNRFQLFSFFASPLFRLIDLFCVQNVLYRDRFASFGIPENKLIVTGNLKLDDEYPQLSPEESDLWKQKLGIKTDQLVLTIGATHNPEEKQLLNLLRPIWKKYPNLKVMIVPRHPERFEGVSRLLESEKISFIRFTDISGVNGSEQVILIDAMGMLRMCYQLSDIAIVGGSFMNGIGGHNILEPCWYGKPVLFGPWMYSQTEFVDFIKQYHAGLQTNLEETPLILLDWLQDEKKRKEIGLNGFHMMKALKGSTEKTINALKPYLENIKNLP